MHSWLSSNYARFNEAATAIQGCYRGYRARQKLIHQVRKEFERCVLTIEGDTPAEWAVEWRAERHLCRPAIRSRLGCPVALKSGDQGTGFQSKEQRRQELLEELRWAEDALDSRRQHLRRSRREQAIPTVL
ncbi:hypothetical protein CYMTET_37196 [Cymbomonas tetramitiformis]|uniref:Uncharacterized protein n=1 Tax=Cymbomonas tetramitiformis TaxID=36881 RepID=A0AAE0CFR9_9CHLO|nr:hypothetical protein CYMTET_37196 [Cymbomonas tetramitiformis]